MTDNYVDVLIVGAGLSGIGAACHLKDKCPSKSFAILEGRKNMGGTWDLFRYPGIRSDSDMYTLGYNFKPWEEAKAIADGPSILNYIKQTAAEHDIDQHIRYEHKVTRCEWSSDQALWTVEANTPAGTVSYSCNMLLMCAGYYSYKGGYSPKFEGSETFTGQIVHPQKWPEDLDYKNKKVVVIGSGATAVTLIPAMAPDVEHITMLQRSPSYVASSPSEDATANFLRKILPAKIAYKIIRWKNVLYSRLVYRKTRTKPEEVKTQLIDLVREEMGPDYDVDTHFTPKYNPWDQRLCLVPDNNLFEALKSGKASVVTNHISRFSESGIVLQNGESLEADIIVTATGLNMEVLGGIDVLIDGESVDYGNSYTYSGFMFSDTPNLVTTFGYINASWTLRSDLIHEWFCRLVNHMDEYGHTMVAPRLRPHEVGMEKLPYVSDFSSSYIQRMVDQLPKQGPHEPWINEQNYISERRKVRNRPINDGVLVFSNPHEDSAKNDTSSHPAVSRAEAAEMTEAG